MPLPVIHGPGKDSDRAGRIESDFRMLECTTGRRLTNVSEANSQDLSTLAGFLATHRRAVVIRNTPAIVHVFKEIATIVDFVQWCSIGHVL